MKKRLLCCFRALIVVVFAVYLGFSPRFAGYLYEHRLLQPQMGRGADNHFDEIKGVEDHELYFRAVDGNLIHARFFKNPSSRRVLLYNIGSAGDLNSRLSYVHALVESGLSVFIYDYRGFGSSEGKADSLQGICDDGVSAFDFLIGEKYKPKDIIVLGESLGSAVATYVSVQRPVGAIIVQSGLYSLERSGRRYTRWLQLYPSSFLFAYPPMNNADILAENHAPLLIIHGAGDQVIPIGDAQALYEVAKGPKTFVTFPNSDHFGLSDLDHDLLRSTMDQFLATLP